jgi:hypothetical protein
MSACPIDDYMHLYLRIILDSGPESYSTAEEQQLRDCLTSAPGVETVKEIKRHPRGGYSVTMERTGDTIDPLISYISASRYRAVI